MKKQCLLGLLLLFTACVFGQNEYYIAAPKWGLKPQSLTMNLPSPGDQGNYPFNGYDGRGSEHFATQNIQVDHNGRLLFFILGQNVFDRYGKHYATLNQVDLTQSSAMNEMKGMTSNMIVPVHGECHKYHIISTIDQGNNGTTSSARNFYYYSTIHVEYDEFGKLTTNSVPLIRHNPTDAADKTNAYPLQEINDEIENFFNEATTGITVTSMNAQGKRFLFVTNQGSVWRYTIDGINITNGTKIVEYASLFGSGSSQTNQYSRTEFEVITLPNGNFRLTQGLRHFGTTYARSLMFLDFDISGNLIQNSIKQYKYPNDFQKELKGIELTQNGKFAYVTHEVHNGSAIDRIEIEPAGGGVPVSQPLAFSGMNDFFMSAIELTLNHDMMLIGANRVALITNPESSSPGWVDNFLAITTNASNPFHPLSASPSALIYSLNGSLDSDNYGDHFKQAICCQDFSINELDGFILTSDQTWNDQANGGTPLDVDGDNVLHVRNELRIPRGRVLTVNNLRIEFDKNARLIIEEGGNNLSGGKLVLNNTTLTIDERCQEGDIWLGVEVRGNRSFPQGTVSLNSNLNNSQQGHLVMKNKSVIEHAEIGVLVSSRANAGNVYNSHFSMKTGGIVQALGNSEIRDCKRAVFADIYTIQNSLSYFDNCKITWTDSNHFKAQGLPVSSLVYLNGVRNYRFIR
ncbi:MAG: hypothetical protein KJ941_05585, partial [Bacteroidetes bacterium]|nr:hypothetical protein [Bacteroidota bacterium]